MLVKNAAHPESGRHTDATDFKLNIFDYFTFSSNGSAGKPSAL